MSGTLLRVARAEGMHSALQRIQERLREASRLQAMLLRGRFEQDARAPLLNVIGMPPVARLGGLPIQLRARLHQEQPLRRVALHYPAALEVGSRAWRLPGIGAAVARTQASTVHLEGTFGIALNTVLALPVDIILSLHDLGLLNEPEPIRRALLQRARAIIFPSDYLRQRYAVDGQIIAPASPAIATVHEPGIRRRVAYIGSLKRHKGAHLLPDIINATCSDDPSIEWHVFGGGDAELLRPLKQLPRVRVHGYYSATELPCLLTRHRIGLAVLPSIEPESFGLTLSECWSAGVPAISFAHGAYAERIARDGGGWLVPLESGTAGMAQQIAAWLRGDIDTTVPGDIATPRRAALAHLDIYRGLGLKT
jgi:glycosyltransferase involved in cell wall biosynthesis